MPAEGALRDGSGADFELIETMRWEPASGFLRFERHLARLYASASRFGFPHALWIVQLTVTRRREPPRGHAG